MIAFGLALQLLSRIPVRLWRAPTARELGRSVLWYPTVGVLLGLALLLLAALLGDLDAPLKAALLLVFWVWFSGGLHLDGLADTADAWVGGMGSVERTLAIMKDPACGPVGVVSLVLVLLVKWAALVSLLESGVWPALLLAPWVARGALAGLLLSTPYVRPQGMGTQLVEQMPRSRLLQVLVLHAVLVLLFGWSGLLALLVATLLTLFWRQRLRMRIGGTTGDTAGALVEVLEAALLVALAVLPG
ncbi:adenosylcobinamide-GDP ribazoletransferase [Halopseudomonas aestusnigri]|uniref:Adenosylcobinamide-GDP ribazoletransferase n=1 Tax=Halopseudomonas aestusnigri TaxID=857252 RepID=A0AAQ1G5L5_9GAMM|nr:adenosylcobinamide-GDP ribazoletransferase [Halopseudomonas aestusnigri]OWL90183.1 adenosylcobinamide-GDP ribazoletransferase [Halopseudomonas aestusnigri]SEF85512.1 cobalamin-5'-phosphate synthase [Halopseudomonas aestusnigri]